jgi:uncharacterized sporulation protein YeaH/YhbH (DUF444 family)
MKTKQDLKKIIKEMVEKTLEEADFGSWELGDAEEWRNGLRKTLQRAQLANKANQALYNALELEIEKLNKLTPAQLIPAFKAIGANPANLGAIRKGLASAASGGTADAGSKFKVNSPMSSN